MPIFINQSSFSSGEISPEAQARVDIAKYKTGVKTMRNFLPGTKGQASRRPGTSFIAATKYNDRASRLIPFVFSAEVSYVIEFGDEYVRFYKNGAQILASASSSTIPYWNTNQYYSLDDYVLEIRNDFTTHLYKSLKYANVANDPQSSASDWTDLGSVTTWDSSLTYGAGAYVAEIRSSDGSQRIFQSAVAGNHANDPLNPTNYWQSQAPDVWDSGHTYSTGDYVSFTDGFGNVSIYRSMRDFNTGHDIFTETLWWQFWNGSLTWSAATTYAVGDYVIRTDGGGIFRSFLSIRATNLNHDPLLTGTVYWNEITQALPYEISMPYSYADLSLLKFTQSADILFIAHKDYPPYRLSRIADDSWETGPYILDYTSSTPTDGPFRVPNTIPSQLLEAYTSGAGTFLVTAGTSGPFDLFQTGMENAIFQLNYDVAEQNATGQSTVPGISLAITCGGTWRLKTSGTWTGTIVVQMSLDNSTWNDVQTFHSTNDINYDTFGTIDNDDDPFYIRLRIISLTGTLGFTISADPYIQTGIFQVTSIDTARIARGRYIKNIIENGQTSDWAEGAWSTYRGFPGTVAFSQDRLVWGGNNSEPQTEWMTVAGSYYKFTRHHQIIDSDGITVNLTSRQINPIRSLVAFLNSLMAYTGSSEFSTDGISDGPLTPTNVFVKVQGFRGINHVDPVIVGGHILFVSQFSTSVRAMIFNLLNNNFESPNISTLSDHFLIGYEIDAMAYQQEPYSTVWMVRSDGKLVSLTYIKEEEIIGWALHDTQDGLFESVVSIPGSECDEVWFVVKRGDLRFVERMTKRVDSTDPADQYFVDCGLTYDGDAVSSLTGLSQLNGQSVAINAEGFVLPNQTVSNGTITLDQARSKVVAGLPITSDLELLNPDYAMKDGTSQGRKYHLGACIIRFLNSRGGFVGMDEDTLLQEFDFRDEDLAAATPTPLFSGYSQQSISVPQNEDPRGHLMFRQTDPMPTTILAITTVIDPGEKL